MRSKKVIKNIVVSIATQVLTIICGFVIPKLTIENFGSSINGLISSIAQFLGYITLLESGIGPVIMSALYKPLANKDNKEISNVLRASESFFRKIAYIFIIYLIVLSIVFPFSVNKQFDIFFTMSLIVIIAISTFAEYFFGVTYSFLLQADQKSYIISEIQIITTILNTILVVFLIKIGAGIHIVKLASTMIFVIRPIVQYIYVKKNYTIDLKNADKNFKLEQKWDGFSQHIASVIHSNTDVAVLTFFSNLNEVSVYSVYMLVIKGIKSLILSLKSGISAFFGNLIVNGEKETLNRGFRVYELCYFTIVTIVFICTVILIVPFVGVYTKNILDIDYIRPTFAVLMVLAEFFDTIRQPYSAIIISAGCFRNTKIGGWVEAGVNLGLSIIFVILVGIEGVAVGTLVAMIIRTIEFICFSSKHILNRSIFESVKWAITIAIEFLIIYLLKNCLIGNFIVLTYLDWLVYALIIGMTSVCVVCLINIMFFKNTVKDTLNILKNLKK